MLSVRAIDDIQRLIDERVREGIQIEFKEALPDRGKNEDMAKAIASLANGEGGVLIYGIREDKDTNTAAGMAPVQLAGAAERIAQVAQTIDGPVALRDVHLIELPTDRGSGFIVVEIVKSDRAPHVVDGYVIGRSPRGRVQLTRRAIGDLFARSRGFAQEFGLATIKPGRVTVRGVTERDGPPNAVSDGLKHWLLFENVGDAEVLDVNWSFARRHQPSPIVEPSFNPFPITRMDPGFQLRVPVIKTVGSDHTPVVTVWWVADDGHRTENEREYNITF